MIIYVLDIDMNSPYRYIAEFHDGIKILSLTRRRWSDLVIKKRKMHDMNNHEFNVNKGNNSVHYLV